MDNFEKIEKFEQDVRELNTSDDVELAGVDDVKAYQRRTATGQVVQVKGYVRTSSSQVAERARSAPGRPAVAAGNGRFAGDRSIPVWPDAGKKKPGMPSDDEPDFQEYEGMEDTGVVDQATLDKEIPVALEILPNLPQNPSLKKLIEILRGETTASLSDDYTPDDEDIVELAVRRVAISGYSYINKKGKLVVVNPYVQMRAIINAMGGPAMAARKGVTPDLLDRSFPSFDVKNKLFKAKPKKRSTKKKIARTLETDKGNLAKLNRMQVDREFDIPAPKNRKTALSEAMRPYHPTESVRSAPEGSTVTRGSESWTRALDGKWYKTPRRNTKGITDEQLTEKLVSKAGVVSLKQGRPTTGRPKYENNKVDTEVLDPNSKHYAESLKYAKSLEKVYQHIPEGVADSLNGRLRVENPRDTSKDKSFVNMTYTRSTKTDDYLPSLVVHPNPEFEKDLMRSLPKQQQVGYSAPSLDHPLEVMMTRETGVWTEKLLEVRAPDVITDRMYDKLSAAYDKVIKSDDGDYSGLSGRAGWLARTMGERSNDIKKDITDNLSMTAQRSPEDFLAEAWVEYTGTPDPRPLALEMGKAFQEAQEEFSDYLFKHNWFDASEIPEKEYSRITPPPSRRISDIVGGVEDTTVVVPHSPRDMRSILTDESRFFNIRGEDGNEIFDAEIGVGENRVEFNTLSLPRTDASTMPNDNVEPWFVMRQKGARYYESPDKATSPEEIARWQQRYADFVDQDKAVSSIHAIEEMMSSEGHVNFYSSPRAGEDSITYARAGYVFDPDLTEVHEVSQIIEDVSGALDAVATDQAEGYFLIDKDEVRKMRRKISEFRRDLTNDPSTWPTPEQIADLGKTDEVARSVGEEVLDNYSWSGYKKIDPPKGVDPKSAPDLPPPVSATAIKSASDDIANFSPTNVDGVRELIDNVTKRHSIKSGKISTFVTSDGNNSHSILVKDVETGDRIFSLDVYKNSDGSITWQNLDSSQDEFGGLLGYEILDSLETAYQRAGITDIRDYREAGSVTPHKVSDNSRYTKALMGFDWASKITKDEFSKSIKKQIDAQMEKAREDLLSVETARNMGGTTEDIINAQRRVDRDISKMRESIEKQAGALAEKFDDPEDPKGPTPFEVAQIGRKEAFEVASRVASSPRTGDPSAVRGVSSVSETIESRARRAVDAGGDPSDDEFEFKKPAGRISEEGKEGKIIFAGKQFLTLGGYEMLKTAEGFWSWGTNMKNTSARRESVGLLFLLLRLLPSSVYRGAILTTARTITKKTKSPRPSDWPSQDEINRAIESVKSKIPDDKLAELEDRMEDLDG